MNAEERMALIRRNTVELVTEGEIGQLLREKKRPVTYCGYEPSGEVHLGHAVTTTKLMDLADAGFEVKVLLADWHAFLNNKGDWDFINGTTKMWEKAFKKLGLKDAKFVLGSQFQMKEAYIADLLTLCQRVTVNRGLRAMQEVSRDIENAKVSQAVYPLMQANDIKHLGVDVAEAGIEQRKIHMLAREHLEGIGYRKPMFVHTPLINSLLGSGTKMSSSVPGTKMSSSDKGSLISVRDSTEEIKKKIARAYCPERAAENNPVLEIVQLVIFPRLENGKKAFEVRRPEKFGGDVAFSSYAELHRAFAEGKLHPADLKAATAAYLAEIFAPVREVFK
ncbi:MAG: tyrosine--tRNA ligase [Candidatus Diapherotrites archaeon]